jgi:arylsulfatase
MYSIRFNRLTAPDIYRYDFDIKAHVELGNETANGVLLASGDSAAGYELFMRDGYLEFVYVYTRENVFTLKSNTRIDTGQHIIGLSGKVTGKGSGQINMMFDGRSVASRALPNMWKVEALNAGIRCGENRGAPISFAYAGSNKFNQTLKKVEFTLSL